MIFKRNKGKRKEFTFIELSQKEIEKYKKWRGIEETTSIVCGWLKGSPGTPGQVCLISRETNKIFKEIYSKYKDSKKIKKEIERKLSFLPAPNRKPGRNDMICVPKN